MPVSAGAASDVGRVRTANQDAWCITSQVFAVADGMGGHPAGDRASRIAVEALARIDDGSVTVADVHRALATANRSMIDESRGLDSPRGMGTTVAGIAAVEVDGAEHWAVFNIGDSRVYQWQRGTLAQISVDHSEVQEMIDAGRWDASEAAVYPRRHVITRSLGSPRAGAADTWLLPRSADQLFLICSDGLTGELDDLTIAACLAGPGDPTELAQHLVDEAVAAGGRDNVTAVVVRTAAAASPQRLQEDQA
ncbi:MAG: protein phosphatase 2C domain-containing protein [Propionibacteriales bacterium]|nr:protein phosphatase 2C domain-containing protein [Propionibacteriales bacterium]